VWIEEALLQCKNELHSEKIRWKKDFKNFMEMI